MNLNNYSFSKTRAKALGIQDHFDRQDLSSILERYGEKCQKCNSEDNLSIDHIIPLALGGNNSVENIQILCKSCNSKKSTKAIDYRGGIALEVDTNGIEQYPGYYKKVELKVTRKYTLDADTVRRLEELIPEGKWSKFVNDAIDEKLKEEEQG